MDIVVVLALAKSLVFSRFADIAIRIVVGIDFFELGLAVTQRIKPVPTVDALAQLHLSAKKIFVAKKGPRFFETNRTSAPHIQQLPLQTFVANWVLNLRNGDRFFV